MYLVFIHYGSHEFVVILMKQGPDRLFTFELLAGLTCRHCCAGLGEAINVAHTVARASIALASHYEGALLKYVMIRSQSPDRPLPDELLGLLASLATGGFMGDNCH